MDATRKPLVVGQARITRILHPTDFSPSCERAFEYARLLSAATGAEIHLLHVIGLAEELRSSETTLRKAYAEAEKQLHEWTERAGGPTLVAHEVRFGAPHTEIVRYAKEQKIDFVVMGTLGMSGDAVTPVGSTAEKVLQALSIPVLAVKVPPPTKARSTGRRCTMCGALSPDIICSACQDRVRGEAALRHRG